MLTGDQRATQLNDGNEIENTWSSPLQSRLIEMFGPLKEALGSKRCETNYQLEKFVHLDSRLTSFYENGNKKLPQRWENCTIKEGNCIEKNL